MTAPLRSNQHASAIAAIAASQNKAPVAEFRCLFTHDVRRKQKRWHDGFLKFHSFNHRVMVYDLARNFLGDTYHKDSDELHEGDELTLNNGPLVEVSEPVGISHTDLTSILSKKPKDAPPGPSAHSQTKAFQRPSSVAPANAQTLGTQLRHKSLNTILGTPKGPIGKAQPIRSPYEVRKEKERENELVEERAAKRQKTGQDERLGKQEKLLTLAKNMGAHKARQPPSFIPPAATVITLDSEPDLHPQIFSDVTLPSTPPQVAKKRQERQKAKTVVSGQLPAQTPKIPKGKVPVPSVRALETPRQPAPPSSPPVSVSNRLSNVDFALQPAKVPRKESSPPPPAPSSPPARKTKCLRLAAGVKRGKLLCQSLPSESAKPDSGAKVVGTEARRTASHAAQGQETLPGVGQKDHISAPSKRPPRAKRILADTSDDAPKRMRVSKSPTLPSPSLQEDPEVVHGHMDQQLLLTSSPVRPHLASSPPVDTVSMARSPFEETASEIALQEKSPRPTSANSKPLSTEKPNNKRPVKKKTGEKRTASRASPPGLDPGIPASREVSQTRSEAFETSLQTSSKSRKLPVSTGFWKSKNLTKAPADPIEDEEDASHVEKPPNRSFRRVRSENDTPIPMGAEAQEKGNLSNPSTSPVSESVSEPAMAERAVTKKKKKDSGLGALIKRTDPRRKFKRMQTREIETDMALPAGVEVEEEVELESLVVDVDVGPWSTEAGDFFDWRPLGRD